MNALFPHEPFTRRAIEDEIERLLSMLDAMDGDCDLEDTGDAEPWLGAPIYGFNGKHAHDLEGDSSDDEPSLGWPEQIDQQRRMALDPMSADPIGEADGTDEREDANAGDDVPMWFDGTGQRRALDLLASFHR